MANKFGVDHIGGSLRGSLKARVWVIFSKKVLSITAYTKWQPEQNRFIFGELSCQIETNNDNLLRAVNWNYFNCETTNGSIGRLEC